MASDAARYPSVSRHWLAAARILPAQYAEQTVWSALVEEDDLPGALALLRRVDPAMYDSLGPIDRVAGLGVMRGEGAGWVMPAFTWGGPGRFNDTAFSAFYAAREVETAIAETVYHQARALRDESAPPIEIRMRSLRAEIDATELVELTDLPETDPVYHPTDYAASQTLGADARAKHRNGILFTSVRRPRYLCVALFQPSQLVQCTDAEGYVYRWDGTSITVERRTTVTW